jgi:hypothetical protein
MWRYAAPEMGWPWDPSWVVLLVIVICVWASRGSRSDLVQHGVRAFVKVRREERPMQAIPFGPCIHNLISTATAMDGERDNSAATVPATMHCTERVDVSRAPLLVQPSRPWRRNHSSILRKIAHSMPLTARRGKVELTASHQHIKSHQNKTCHDLPVHPPRATGTRDQRVQAPLFSGHTPTRPPVPGATWAWGCGKATHRACPRVTMWWLNSLPVPRQLMLTPSANMMHAFGSSARGVAS